MKKVLVLLLLGGALAACSEEPMSPEDAFQPAMSRENAGRTVRFEDEFPATGQLIGSCGDWNVLTDYLIHSNEMILFDKAGQLVQVIARYKVVEPSVYYNDLNPSKHVHGIPAEHEIDHVFFVDGAPSLLRMGGVPVMVTIPHYGVIYGETGELVIDLNTNEVQFNAGHNDFQEQDVAALCDYLQ
ncbi:MAG: hypothetical protein FIB01_05760 [Gemmatimonadetes bacterium]|nr:hypothetical protein [Gemmatimonadota bacterium]